MAINLPNYERQTEILNNTNDIKIGLAQAGKTPRRQLFTSNGTWTAPIGVTRVFVTGGGGGGGGAAIAAVNNKMDGTAGGITSFGTLLSLGGGGGGHSGPSSTSLNDIIGDSGGFGGQVGGYLYGTSVFYGGNSGNHKANFCIYYGNAAPVSVPKSDNCCGGGGFARSTSVYVGGGGGGSYVEGQELSVTPGTSYPITIGVGGIGGTITESSLTFKAGDGGNGYLIIEWWE